MIRALIATSTATLLAGGLIAAVAANANAAPTITPTMPATVIKTGVQTSGLEASAPATVIKTSVDQLQPGWSSPWADSIPAMTNGYGYSATEIPMFNLIRYLRLI